MRDALGRYRINVVAELTGVPAATLRAHSRQLIQQTLAEQGGNVQRTARLLGISRGTLYRRLREPESQAGV